MKTIIAILAITAVVGVSMFNSASSAVAVADQGTRACNAGIQELCK